MDSYHYDSGEKLFTGSEMIYINLSVEQAQCHRHAHDFIEIAYVTSGKGVHRIGSREYTVSKGDLFVINYDVEHEFRPDASDPRANLMVYNCVFRPQFLDHSLMESRCFSDITHVFLLNSLSAGDIGDDIRLINRDIPEIQELYEKMYREYSLKKYGYIDMLRALLLQLLVEIFRAYRECASEERKANDEKYFDTIIRFMKQHYNQEIKLEDLAAMSFLSRSAFCSKFKECTGQTVLEYLQYIRIREACSMLSGSSAKIVDIAQAVGYRDLKFFNRLFKSITGKTPSEYRKRQTEGTIRISD